VTPVKHSRFTAEVAEEFKSLTAEDAKITEEKTSFTARASEET